VKLIVPGHEAELKDAAAAFDVCSTPISELADLAANRPLMARLASGTDGHLYRSWELTDLGKHLPQVTWTEKRNHQDPLWQSFWLLGAFCVLVAAEWVLRKRQGLL